MLGVGCAAPYNLDSFTSNETHTYFGQALAVVQALSEDDMKSQDTSLKIHVSDGEHSTSVVIPLSFA